MTDSHLPISHTFERALKRARNLREPVRWRRGMARELFQWIGPEHVHSVVVASAPFGAWDRLKYEVWPSEHEAAQCSTWGYTWVPRMIESGWDWRIPYERFGPVYRAADALPPTISASLASVLESSGAAGCLITLVVSQRLRCPGFFVLNTRVPEREVLLRYGRRLKKVAATAARAIEDAISLTSELGVRSPSLGWDAETPLSVREREVAVLVAQGLSDLNIAARLGIAESTVGTHLHRVFRKLGVHTRVQLARAIGV